MRGIAYDKDGQEVDPLVDQFVAIDRWEVAESAAPPSYTPPGTADERSIQNADWSAPHG